MRPPYAGPEICCDGKDKLQTMNLAREVALRMTERRHTPVGAYKCPHCGFYHVGHKQTKGNFHGRPK